MSRETTVELIRGGWLTLAFMMLLSRVVFQAAGPVRMRRFLDGWQNGAVKRFWGAASLGFAGVLAIAAVGVLDELSTFDLVLLAGLLLVLVADGAVNVLPAGFETFKDRVQRAWVSRRRGTGTEGDRYLFGTVNALLALGSATVAAVVIAYRPIDPLTLSIAAGVATVLVAVLIGASEATSRWSRGGSNP